MQEALLVVWPDSDSFHIIEPVSGDYVYSNGHGFCESLDYIIPHSLTPGFEIEVDTDLYAKANGDGEILAVEQSAGRKIGTLGGGYYIRHKMENPTNNYHDFEIYDESGSVIHTIVRFDNDNIFPPDITYSSESVGSDDLATWACLWQGSLLVVRNSIVGYILMRYELATSTTTYTQLNDNTINPWDDSLKIFNIQGNELYVYTYTYNITYGADDIAFVVIDSSFGVSITTLGNLTYPYSGAAMTGAVHPTMINGSLRHNMDKGLFRPEEWKTVDYESTQLSCGVWNFTTREMLPLTLAVVPGGVLPAKIADWTSLHYEGEWEIVGDSICLYLSYSYSVDANDVRNNAAVGKLLVWSALDGSFVHAKSCPPRPFQSVSDTYLGACLVVNVDRHEITGTVRESGEPAETELRMVGRNGELLATTVSDETTGAYRFACFTNSPKTIMAKNPTTGQWRSSVLIPTPVV